MNKKIIVIALLFVIIVAGAVFGIQYMRNPEPSVSQSSQDVVQQEQEQEKQPEFHFFVKPSNAADDLDRDGVSNEEEQKRGLSSEEFDTDGDSISDKDEIDIWKTDPTKADTDGDGYPDGLEVVGGYNPNGEGKLTQP